MLKKSFFILLLSCFTLNIYAVKPIPVFVSILPLKYFVARIAENNADIHVMVRPGHSPETYSPTPSQMTMLSQSKIYYRIDVPFEKAWMPKIKKLYPQLKIINLRADIKLSHFKKSEDPHIWNDPLLVMQMAKTIRDSLITIDSAHKKIYQKNYAAFIQDLKKLNQSMQRKLRSVKGKTFLVYHPAWGYFANRYGLKQVSIEKEGKTAGSQDLKAIIQLAEKEHLRAIFIEPQFSKAQAKMLSETLDLKLVVLNPLAEDYLDNMRQTADKLTKFKPSP